VKLLWSFATPSGWQQAAAMAIGALPLGPEASDSFRGPRCNVRTVNLIVCVSLAGVWQDARSVQKRWIAFLHYYGGGFVQGGAATHFTAVLSSRALQAWCRKRGPPRQEKDRLFAR